MLKNTNSPVILPHLLLFVIVAGLVLQSSTALKCRSEDGPTEAELKRVTRSCMRKVGESVHFNGGGQNGDDGPGINSNGFGNNGYNGGGSNSNFHYGGSNGYHYNNNNNYGQQNNYRSDYDSDEDSDDSYERGGGNMATGGRDIFQQRNRERNPILNKRNSNGGSGGNGGSNSNSNIGGRSNGNSNSNTGNSNNNNNNNNNKDKYSGNQKNSNQKSYNGRSRNNGRGINNQYGDNNRNNGTVHDTGCVVHCFFEEMSMLNRDDYPDKHKVIYMLTKDLRDRELRNFYTETIQSCFRYMESQRRREKCQFSRELIQCLAEHAKANCDDWDEYNVMFN